MPLAEVQNAYRQGGARAALSSNSYSSGRRPWAGKGRVTQMPPLTEQPIHFFHFDERFCGASYAPRRVTVDEDEITCPKCQHNADNVCYILSDEALERYPELRIEAAKARP